MRLSSLPRNHRGGVLLDAVVVLGLVLIGAWMLQSVGLSFGELVHGAARFFGY